MPEITQETSQARGKEYALVHKTEAEREQVNMPDYEQLAGAVDWKKVARDLAYGTTGQLNCAHECVDRWVETGRGDQVAIRIVKEGDSKSVTYQELADQSNRVANFLTRAGVQKGEIVLLLLPLCPEYYATYFGALKVGAVVAPLFEALTHDGLDFRFQHSRAPTLVTSPFFKKRISYTHMDTLERIILVDDDGDHVPYGGRDVYDWQAEVAKEAPEFTPLWMAPEAPMILQYTARSKETPKGILLPHRAVAYLHHTGKTVLDFHEGDVFWCTADPGVILGNAYGIVCPLACGVRLVAYTGRFDVNLWLQVIKNEGVTTWYSSPTVFRLLQAAGKEALQRYKLDALRRVFSVGEPLSPGLIEWALQEPPAGLGLVIHDTWWTTECGGIVVANFPACDVPVGSIGRPVPGVEVAVLDDATGNPVPAGTRGRLAVKKGWPAMFVGVLGNDDAYAQYFPFDPWFVSPDHAVQDEAGYLWLEPVPVIETIERELSPFEVEQKILEHPAVEEAGVLGVVDPEHGNVIKVFVKTRSDYEPLDHGQLHREIFNKVKRDLGERYAPRGIFFLPYTAPDGTVVEELPKTRSGKIMRRVLKDWLA